MSTISGSAGPGGLGGLGELGELDPARLAEICRRYGIVSLQVFGSVARGEPLGASDVDLLYELGPDTRLGWEIDDLTDELAEVFGRSVDLVARQALHPLLRASVLGEARAVYAA